MMSFSCGEGIILAMDFGEDPQHKASGMEKCPRWGSRRGYP